MSMTRFVNVRYELRNSAHDTLSATNLVGDGTTPSATDDENLKIRCQTEDLQGESDTTTLLLLQSHRLTDTDRPQSR